MKTAADRKHARLAPSASHRWIECPGSLRESEGEENTSSVFAAEGTAAHELCSHCMEKQLDAVEFLGNVIDIEASTPAKMFHGTAAADFKTRFEVDEEMAESVQFYLDHVRGLIGAATGRAELDIEQHLDMTHIHPEIFGTGDAVVFDEGAKHLHVVDFKYGKGVDVDPDGNPQLLTYGAGAAMRYHNREVEKVSLWVVQPRTSGEPIKPAYTIGFIELLEFEMDLAEAAKRTEDPDAPLKAGDWCLFCPAKGKCTEYRRRVHEIAVSEFAEDGAIVLKEIETMTPDDMAKVLKEADLIGNWLKAVQEKAHADAANGKYPTGFKLVAKRAVRKWKDEDVVKATLQVELNIPHDEIYTDPKLKSPAQVEKMLGKKAFAAEMAEWVVQQSSGTNLVPESDKRPAVRFDAASDFGGS